MAKENKSFTKLLNKFYENGLLKEVYRSEKTIVCNVFNQFYIAFSLDINEVYTDEFPCFMMGTLGLKKILEDNSFVMSYYANLTEEQKDKVLILFNEDYFRHLLKNKDELLATLPNPKLDLRFEQELIEALR